MEIIYIYIGIYIYKDTDGVEKRKKEELITVFILGSIEDRAGWLGNCDNREIFTLHFWLINYALTCVHAQ